MTYAAIGEAATEAGLGLRGGFLLDPHERTGALAKARCIVLLGVVGANNWPQFAAGPEIGDGQRHPLDRWSRRIVEALAARFGAEPLFPFEGPPYWPFQSWALRAEPVSPSPLGLMIHPLYGLWHSYRGALALPEALELPAWERTASPCETCAGRPCLSACPVGAMSEEGYDLTACAGWLRRPEGAPCVSGGCLARRACPVGVEHTQGSAQAQFHMKAFLAARA